MVKQRVVWRDPPDIVQGRRNAGEFLEFAVALRSRPGKWAVLPSGSRDRMQCAQLVSNIKRGANSSFRPPSDFEFRQSKEVIYARYVGE